MKKQVLLAFIKSFMLLACTSFKYFSSEKDTLKDKVVVFFLRKENLFIIWDSLFLFKLFFVSFIVLWENLVSGLFCHVFI